MDKHKKACTIHGQLINDLDQLKKTPDQVQKMIDQLDPSIQSLGQLKPT
jgi:hypothetical protein